MFAGLFAISERIKGACEPTLLLTRLIHVLNEHDPGPRRIQQKHQLVALRTDQRSDAQEGNRSQSDHESLGLHGAPPEGCDPIRSLNGALMFDPDQSL